MTQLLALRPVTYKWKKEGDDGRLQLGLIAQEVQKVVPEVVLTGGPTDMLSINYPALIPVAIKAIQEQQKTIERQEARIASLERGRAPLASLVSGSVGEGVVLGLLPTGLVALLRRRRKQQGS